MNWFGKLRRNVESRVYESRAEGQSQRHMDDVIHELQTGRAEAEEAVSSHLATVGELTARAEEAHKLVAARKDEAMAALASGNEELAKRILADATVQEARAAAADELLQQALRTTDDLRRHLQNAGEQELRLREERDALNARAEVARLQRNLADIESGIDTRSRSFEKMADTVAKLELETEAHQEVAGGGLSAPASPEQIDARLEELRQALSGKSQSEPKDADVSGDAS